MPQNAALNVGFEDADDYAKTATVRTDVVEMLESETSTGYRLDRPMKIAILGAILLSLPQLSLANDCSNRIIEERKPIYPRHETPWEFIENGQSCLVSVEYVLSAEGVPSDVEVSTNREVCQAFYRSAKKAIFDTKFSRGQRQIDCNFEYTFKYD